MVAVARTLPAPPELSSRWAAVLEEAELRPRVLEIAQRFPEERSLQVPFAALDSADTLLADLLLEDPEPVIQVGQADPYRPPVLVVQEAQGHLSGLRARRPPPKPTSQVPRAFRWRASTLLWSIGLRRAGWDQ